MRALIRRISRAGAVLLAVCTSMALCVPAIAAEPEEVSPKTYKVRFFSGRCGEIDVNEETGAGLPMVEYEWEYNHQITGDDFFALDRATATDDRYYVKGIRESGKDFQEEGSETIPSTRVTHDIDYVVYYGMKGHMVPYTVNYVDGTNGNELRKSDQYYGNVGDRVVVPFRYIAGWQPQAFNIALTLKEEGNVINFEYTRIQAASAATGSGSGSGSGGSGNSGTGGGSGTEDGTAADDAASGGGTVVSGGGETEGGTAADTDIRDDASPESETPQELLDLDEKDTPLSSIGEGIKKIIHPEGDGMLVKFVRPVAGLGLAALLLLLFFLYKRRKNEKKDTSSNG